MSTDGWVYMQIEKGMQGLKQAGKIANDRLKKHLKITTPTLWRHATRPTIFCLVVDNFGVKYESLQDARHLLNALRDLYSITVDWTGNLYYGLTLD